MRGSVSLRYANLAIASSWHKIKFALPAAILAVSGCATPVNNDTSQAYNKNKADPLGAYLASQDFIKVSGTPEDEVNMATLALNQLGIKYRFGGGAPSTGFDCSGLVVYAAEKSLGLKLPRRSAEIAQVGQSVQKSELKEGDLVFFNTRGHRFSHVGIYLGDQKFVHAPRTGSVVRIESMDVNYWKQRYNGARRLSPDNENFIATVANR